jgi:hypothetical protein
LPRVLLKKNPKKSLKLQKTKVILFYSITQQIKYKFNHMEMESNLVIDYEQLVSIYPINYNSNQTIYTLSYVNNFNSIKETKINILVAQSTSIFFPYEDQHISSSIYIYIFPLTTLKFKLIFYKNIKK